MNKVIFGLVLAVCVLGMALLMLNERLGRNPEPQDKAVAPQIVTEKEVGLEPLAPVEKPDARTEPSPAEMSQAAAEFERKMAIEALAPPARDIDEPNGGETAPPRETPDREIREKASASVAPGMPQRPARPDPKQVAEKPVPPKPVAEKSAPAKAVIEKPAVARPVAEAPRPAAKPEPKPEAKPAEKTKPEPKAAEKPKAQGGQKDITRFVVFARDKGATIRISGNEPLHYKSMELDNPPRLVIDFDGDWTFPADQKVPQNALVDKVRVGRLNNKTRLVIDLKEKPRVSRVLPGKNGDSLDWRVDQ